jgi:excisionase family DNA binding protein
MDERLMTVQDAAVTLAFSTRQVQRWIKVGQIRAIHFGRAVRIDPGEIAKIKKFGINGKAESILPVTADCTVFSRSRKRKGRLWDT